MNRITLIVASLLLLFFVATSSGFANISAIQEKLREIQVKLIRERLKLIQEDVSKVGERRAEELASQKAVETPASREELSLRLEGQIRSLEEVIVGLRPKAVEEETARIEGRLKEIRSELETAQGAELLALRRELETILTDYNRVQGYVAQSLQESLQQKQVLLLREQVRVLREKIQTLPKPVLVMPPKADENGQRIVALQEEIEKIRLKILQAQVKTLQESVDKARAQ